jgi:hypothetical protein
MHTGRPAPAEIYAFVGQTVHEKAREFIRLDSAQSADNEAIMRELCAAPTGLDFCGADFMRSEPAARCELVTSM